MAEASEKDLGKIKKLDVRKIWKNEATEFTPSGRRLFDGKTIERIKLIKKLNDSGYPLRAIRELFIEGRTDLKGSKQ